MRSRLVLMLGLILVGCHPTAGSQSPLIAPRDNSACLNARLASQDEPRPTRVSVVNETGLDLRVVIDQCLEHLFLGTVEAGRSGGFRLPPRLVQFPEGLRFHVFSVSPLERYGTFALKLEAPLPALVISDDTPRITYEVPQGLASPRRWLGNLSTSVGEGRAHASAFASGTSAVLSWQCLGSQPFIVLTAARQLDESPEVTAVAPGGPETSFGEWEVVRSVSDAAVAPSAMISPFTLFALSSAHLSLRLSTEAEVPQGHQFSLRGLEAALRELPCFAKVVRGRI